jgi:probable HAF family extracellular repeat protein
MGRHISPHGLTTPGVTDVTHTTICCLIFGTLMLTGDAFGQPYTFIAVDVRCPAAADASACPTGLFPGQVATATSVRGINASGNLVGSYTAAGKQHGFLFQDGAFSTLDFPITGVRATIANGINARGEIVGQYVVPVHDVNNPPSEDSPLYCPSAADPACTKGFHYWRGQFRTVMFPVTVDENGQEHKHPGAIAQRITADGDIYGCLHDHDLSGSMVAAAWTRSGAFSLLANGGETSDPMAVPMSMNNGAAPGHNTIVGLFMDMLNQQHGYVVRDGVLEPYDPTPTTTLTAIWDINTHQQFVGTYRESGEPAAKRHAFMQPPHGFAPVTFDFACQASAGCAGAPFGTVAFATVALGINADSVIVGNYSLVSNGPAHGFVAIPSDTD